MVYIKEALPNPSGDEAQGEWVSLINQGEESISLINWSISDESGKEFSLSTVGSIAPGETVVFKRQATEIALNNNGDTIYLKDELGDIVDQLSYQGSIIEDEKVVADQFIPEAPIRDSNLQANTLESGILSQTLAHQALIVGISLALIAAFGVWIVLGKRNE